MTLFFVERNKIVDRWYSMECALLLQIPLTILAYRAKDRFVESKCICFLRSRAKLQTALTNAVIECGGSDSRPSDGARVTCFKIQLDEIVQFSHRHLDQVKRG